MIESLSFVFVFVIELKLIFFVIIFKVRFIGVGKERESIIQIKDHDGIDLEVK